MKPNPFVDDPALLAWAKRYGTREVKFLIERGFAARSDVLDGMAIVLAAVVGGRVMHPTEELIRWRPRAMPRLVTRQLHQEMVQRVSAWLERTSPPGEVEIVVDVDVLRIEQQTRVEDPTSVLKFSGGIVTLRCGTIPPRFVLVNFEAETMPPAKESNG